MTIVDCDLEKSRELGYSERGVRDVEFLVESICVRVPFPSDAVFHGVLTTAFEPKSGLFWWAAAGDQLPPHEVPGFTFRAGRASGWSTALVLGSGEILRFGVLKGTSLSMRTSRLIVESQEQGRRLALEAFTREVQTAGRGSSDYRSIRLKPYLPPEFRIGKDESTSGFRSSILGVSRPESGSGWAVTIAGREGRSARIEVDSQLVLQDVAVFGEQPSDWDFALASGEPRKDAYWLQAWWADREGRPGDAIAALLKGVQEHPDDRYWCQTLVDFYLRKGNDTEALSWFPRCEASIVETRRQLAQRGGRIALRQDLLKAGGRAFDARRTWEILDHVAGAYARRGDKARALNLLEQAMAAGEARKVLASVVATGGPEQR